MSEDFPALTGFRAGSLLAGYRLEAQVGAGGFAVVFRARDQRLGRLVALKILAPALTADPEFRRRFIAESRAAAAVDDPHIIPVHEAGEANGMLFIAMRFVPGGDLRRVLDREGALAPGRAAEFVSPVASALDAAHAAGLVHRDVKPANILVDARPGRPDHVYLSDFGVSKGAVSSAGLTGTGQFLGTPDYSAPEQIEGRTVDGRADQYALACVAYQLLAGAVPFKRDQGMAVLLAHLSAPPPSLSLRRPGLPGAADDVLARGMAKVPEERYGSCQEFADALREALGLAPYYPRGSAPAPDYPQTEIASPPSGLLAPAAAGTGQAAVPAALAAAATPTSTAMAVHQVTQTAPAPASSAAAQPEAVVQADPATAATDADTATAGPPVTQTAPSPRYSAAGPAVAEPDAGPGAVPGAGGQRATPRADRASWRRPALIATAASIAVIGLVIAITTIPSAPHSSAGPRSSGTPNGSASSHASVSPGSLRWAYTTGGWVETSPAVAGGTVYGSSDDGKVYALDAATGRLRWVKTPGGVAFYSSPAVAGGTVYVGSGDDKVYALDAATGQVRWSYTTGDAVVSGPAVAGGTVYVGSTDDKVYALDAATGRLRWSYTTGGPVWGSDPAVAGGTVYVGSYDHKVYALDAATGSLRWTYTTGGWVEATPAVAGGTVYVGSADHKVYALDVATGQLRWAYTTGGPVWGAGPTVAGGTVYVGSADHKVYALDAATGSLRWAYTTGGPVDYSGPAVADGTVYVGSLDRKVYALDAATGSLRWVYPTAGSVNSSPTVADGTVYVGSDDHKVYALSAGP